MEQVSVALDATAGVGLAGGGAPGQALASGDLALPDGVPQKRALPASAAPGGSLLAKTNMSAFDLAPVPKPAKTMYEHLRGPYFDALLVIPLLIVAIALCVRRCRRRAAALRAPLPHPAPAYPRTPCPARSSRALPPPPPTLPTPLTPAQLAGLLLCALDVRRRVHL